MSIVIGFLVGIMLVFAFAAAFPATFAFILYWVLGPAIAGTIFAFIGIIIQRG